MRGVAWLDGLPEEIARAELLRVTGSLRWIERIVACRPFTDSAALMTAAEGVWDALGPEDWREAFAAHPRIGETRTASGTEVGTWSRDEQSGMDAAKDDVRAALGAAQRRYEARFGHIFLMSAAGRGAEEILAACEARIGNDPATELRTAAAEERKIGRLRLERLLH